MPMPQIFHNRREIALRTGKCDGAEARGISMVVGAADESFEDSGFSESVAKRRRRRSSSDREPAKRAVIGNLHSAFFEIIPQSLRKDESFQTGNNVQQPVLPSATRLFQTTSEKKDPIVPKHRLHRSSFSQTTDIRGRPFLVGKHGLLDPLLLY